MLTTFVPNGIIGTVVEIIESAKHCNRMFYLLNIGRWGKVQTAGLAMFF